MRVTGSIFKLIALLSVLGLGACAGGQSQFANTDAGGSGTKQVVYSAADSASAAEKPSANETANDPVPVPAPLPDEVAKAATEEKANNESPVQRLVGQRISCPGYRGGFEAVLEPGGVYLVDSNRWGDGHKGQWYADDDETVDYRIAGERGKATVKWLSESKVAFGTLRCDVVESRTASR